MAPGGGLIACSWPWECPPGGHEVGATLRLQGRQDGVLEASAVRPPQADGDVPEMMVGGFAAWPRGVGAVGRARPPPAVRHPPRRGHESQPWGMAGPAPPTRVVAAGGAGWLAMAGDHGRVQVQRDALQRRDLAEEQGVHFHLHTRVAPPVATIEQPHDGLVAGHPLPAEAPGQSPVEAYRRGVGEPRRATPDRDDELFDQEPRRITPAGAGQRPPKGAERLPKSEAIQHPVQADKATPGGDFTVREADREGLPREHGTRHGRRLTG